MNRTTILRAVACAASFAAALCLSVTVQAAQPSPIHAGKHALPEQVQAKLQHLLRARHPDAYPHRSRSTFSTSAHPESTGSGAATTWHWANPLPSGDYFESVAEGNGIDVVVGDDGVIYRSTDGTNWSAEKSGLTTGDSLIDVIYAGGQFVASGYGNAGANPVMLTSPDGIAWSINTLSLSQADGQAATHLAYGNGVYVAVNTVAATSTDGKSWTEHNIGTLDPKTSGSDFVAPVFGNGLFVTLAIGSPVIYYSADNGSSWTAATITGSSNDYLYSLAWNGSVFVATGFDASSSCGSNCGLLFTSTDGMTWTQQPDVVDHGGGFDIAVIVKDTTFYSDNFDNALTSTDGIHWTVGAAPNYTYFGGAIGAHPVIYNGSEFLGAGYGPLTLVSNTDFSAWASQSLATGPTPDLSDVIYGNNQYVAVGEDSATGTNVIMTSPDGISWTNVLSSSDDDWGMRIIWTGSEYAAIETNGTVFLSSDGKQWTKTPGGGGSVEDIAYGDGKFVFVDDFGNVQTSPDAQIFANQNSGTTDDLGSIVWTGSEFIATAKAPDCGNDRSSGSINNQTDGKSLFVSADGVTWTPATLTEPANAVYLFCRVRKLGSQWVAVGGSYPVSGGALTQRYATAPVLATSTDGISWTPQSSLSLPTTLYGPISDIAYWNGEYVASLGNNSIGFLSSADMVNWEVMAGTPIAPYAPWLVVHGTQLVAVGAKGSIVYTNSVPPPVATNGSVTTTEGTSIGGTLTASGEGTLTYAIATQPAHGTVTVTASSGAFTYTPTAGYTGSDSFTFTASNSTGASMAATESITVNLPVPTVSNGSVTTTEGTAVSGNLSASGEGTLTYAISTQPAHGTVTVIASSGAFTYTPTAGYTGSDSFTFTASNSGGTSAAATEGVMVNAPANSGGGGSGGGSSGSGSSGGGAFGLLGLLLLTGLGIMRRKRNG